MAFERALGDTFQPGANGTATPQPPQSAVSLLRLRLPTRVSPSAIAPQSLLEGQGGAGLSGGDSAVAQLRRLLQMLSRQSEAPQETENTNTTDTGLPMMAALRAMASPQQEERPMVRDSPRVIAADEPPPGATFQPDLDRPWRQGTF